MCWHDRMNYVLEQVRTKMLRSRINGSRGYVPMHQGIYWDMSPEWKYIFAWDVFICIGNVDGGIYICILNGNKYLRRMSFQGIRKIRDTRRESPLIFESEQLGAKEGPLKPTVFTFDWQGSLYSDMKGTRESEPKAEPLARLRKGSFVVSSSQEKTKKVMFSNFLHINLEGVRTARQGRNCELPKTSRATNLQNTEEEEIQVPQVGLASFCLEFIVGKGGFGKVWKVKEKNTGRIYAMKEMQKVKIISKRSVHLVLNEKQLLLKLKNPFLVNMIHSFQNRENLFLVMDYCNRGDLRYHLGTRHRFREEEVRFFLGCIVIGVEYLHSKKVIHRDLKPQNLVLDDRGYVRITDLGVSREVKANNEEDTSGTPGYMAPEVICKSNHSYPVDFFALGVMGYEFMTGKRPYLGQNRKEIKEKMLAKQVQLDEIPPMGWSRDSVNLVNRLIQRKPEDRLGTNGISEVKEHPFFNKIDWAMLSERRMPSPFLPPTVEEDYANYKECISEDTEIEDIEQYRLVLRHKNTIEAFKGYDSSPLPIISRKRTEKRNSELFAYTTMNIRQKK